LAFRVCGLQSCITIRCLPRPHEFRSCLDLLDEATLAISGTLEKDAGAQYRGACEEAQKPLYDAQGAFDLRES